MAYEYTCDWEWVWSGTWVACEVWRAGTSKTDLVEYVKDKYHNANILCKYTTRPIIYIYTDRNLVVERLKSDGYTQDKIYFRLKRSEACWEDYIYVNPSVEFELISALRGYKREIQYKINQYSYDKNVFLMMRFRDSNKVTYTVANMELYCLMRQKKEYIIIPMSHTSLEWCKLKTKNV